MTDSMTLRQILWRWMGFAALFMVAFWAGLAGFWTAQRDPPLRIADMRLLTPVVRAGEPIRIEHVTFRNDACRLTVERAIIDADRVLFRVEDMVFQAGRTTAGLSESFVEETPVPIAARPGAARLRETLTHVCNPIHRIWPITQRIPDVRFTITARPDR